MVPHKEELNRHGKAKEFNFRARLMTDEKGNFEFESLMPPAYFDPEGIASPLSIWI